MNDGAETTEHLYAWLAVMPPDNVEGIICLEMAQGALPLVVTDLSTATDMRPLAEMVCEQHRSEAQLVVFHRGSFLDKIDRT